MTTLAATDQSRSVAATLGTAINSVTQRWRFETSRLVARWERHSRDAIHMRQLRAMTDRELRDIGLSRADIVRIVSEAEFKR